MTGNESAVGSERITVKEYAAHIGRCPDSPQRIGRKAADWCRRKGVPAGEVEEDGRRVKT